MKNFLLICCFLLHGMLIEAQNTYSAVPVSNNLETTELTLLVFSGSDWCKPCIKLNKEVIATSTFHKFIEGRIQIKEVDFPYKKANRLSKEQTKINESLAEKYNSAGVFPNLILINSNQDRIAVLVSRDLDALMNELEIYLDKS